jgi:serine/threonine protein phosphatase 1
MQYIIGDIHGYYNRLLGLFKNLIDWLKDGDCVIFLGDYIDRGDQSYEVVDFLINISRGSRFSTVFLKGNHEDMLMSYLRGADRFGSYISNGGDATIRSYVAHHGAFTLPEHHLGFYGNLRLYYEGEDFIAVHAGLNPDIDALDEQDEHDLLWIRERFYRANKRWTKTVIFGHTPTAFITGENAVYFDDERNIIGIDSGVIFGKSLSCLVWPEKKIISA